jgi:hypothetical protein
MSESVRRKRFEWRQVRVAGLVVPACCHFRVEAGLGEEEVLTDGFQGFRAPHGEGRGWRRRAKGDGAGCCQQAEDEEKGVAARHAEVAGNLGPVLPQLTR